MSSPCSIAYRKISVGANFFSCAYRIFRIRNYKNNHEQQFMLNMKSVTA